MHLILFLVPFIAVSADYLNFTFIHTNDIHGWINGNKNGKNRDATFADVQNLIEHIKADKDDNTHVFVFDSGGLIHGTGLSDTTDPPGSFIYHLIENSDYDAVTMGNHEMYSGKTTKFLYENVSVNMGERYVCSNVKYNDDQTHQIAHPYRHLNIPDFGHILVIGVLFNMSLADKSVTVTPFEQLHDAGELPWLSTELADENLRFVVLLAHLPPQQDKENSEGNRVMALLKAELENAGKKDLPIVYLAGHDHHTYYYTDSSSTETDPTPVTDLRVESGSYMSHVSVTSFLFPKEKEGDQVITNVANTHVEGNRQIMMDFVHRTADNWNTEKGTKIQQEINDEVKFLKLNDPIGFSKNHYINNSTDTTPTSLYYQFINVMCTTMRPLAPSPSANDEENIQFYTINDGSIRNDLYEGPVLYDDVISIFPFLNTWNAIRGVTYADLDQLIHSQVEKLTTREFANEEREFEEDMKAYSESSGRWNGMSEEERKRKLEERIVRRKEDEESDDEELQLFLSPRNNHHRLSVEELHQLYGVENQLVDYITRYYNISDKLEEGKVYDIITTSYDAPLLLDVLNKLTTNDRTYTIEESEIVLSDTISDYIKKYMPTPDTTPTSPQSPPPDDKPPSTPHSSSTTTIILATVIPTFSIIVVCVIIFMICRSRNQRSYGTYKDEKLQNDPLIY